LLCFVITDLPIYSIPNLHSCSKIRQTKPLKQL